jgi:hypothetical protein
VASIGVVCQRSVYGSRVAQTLKTRKGLRSVLSWFVLLSPTSNTIVFFVLLGMPNRGIIIEESREIGRRSHGAILEFLAVESG